jgi:heme A synthase
MNIIFSIVREDTFWKILLFVHFLLAVSLLAGLTLQAATVLMPARQIAGKFVDRGPVPTASYAPLIVILYVLQVLMGAWIYIKYRTYVRIPMEELRHFWTVGSLNSKSMLQRWAWACFRPIGIFGSNSSPQNMLSCAGG